MSPDPFVPGALVQLIKHDLISFEQADHPWRRFPSCDVGIVVGCGPSSMSPRRPIAVMLGDGLAWFSFPQDWFRVLHAPSGGAGC